MRLFNINGRLQKKSVSKYLINWNKKSRSKVQFKTKKFLEPFWRGHIVYEEFPVYGSRMTVDILNATKKLAVEVQGKQHGEFNKFFHSNSRLKYLEGIKRDIKKAEWLENNGFILLEIEEDEVDSLSLEFFLEKFGMSI
jgi:hypothetical protein|tara:strand:+ start:2093 stop:2509 length:417 start_codon:yes stop_codon:yes gene_type:complete